MAQEKTGQAKQKDHAQEVRRHQRRNSVILIAVLLLLFLLFYLIQKMMTPDSGLTVMIQVDGETAHEMDLDTDAEYTVGDPDGDYNTVVVKNGTVRVTEANCRNQVCVNTGQIQYPGEVIACLPHKLIVYIE